LKPYVEIQGDFEQHLSGPLLVIAVLWISFVWSKRLEWRLAWGTGALWGLIGLVSPSLLPACFLLLVAKVAARREATCTRGMAWTATALLAAVLVLSPWATRNYFALGSPVFSRTNFGLEFHLSNNPEAQPLQRQNIDRGLYACCHPMSNVQQATLIRNLGELAYNQARLRLALAWIRDEPWAFVDLTLRRIWYTWFPDFSDNTALFMRSLALCALTPLGFLGLWFLWRHRPAAAVLLGIPLLVYPVPYYLIHVHVRYRYPVDWIVLFCAVAALWAIFAEIIRHRARRMAHAAIQV
jgi:hypothetical protein